MILLGPWALALGLGSSKDLPPFDLVLALGLWRGWAGQPVPFSFFFLRYLFPVF